MMDIWTTTHSLAPDSLHCGQVGPMSLWIKRLSDELQIAVKRLSEYVQEANMLSMSMVDHPQTGRMDWQRWVGGDHFSEITLTPVMPDRPVVVRPEVPVKILQSRQALFFVSIPIWVQVDAGLSDKVEICQEPVIELSNIWFGDTMSGELCYSLKSKARRKINDLAPKPYRVVCPVNIHNRAKMSLDVERFCVHVKHLNIYQGANHLWSNPVNIIFFGEDDVSKIEYTQKAPDYEPGCKLISKARHPWEKTLLKKSLGTFKLLTGF